MDQAIWASGTAPSDLFDWTYRVAQAIAADNLALGLDVVADCVNDCEEARAGGESAAQHAGAEVRWLEVVCSDPVEHRRRMKQGQPTSWDWLCPTGMSLLSAPMISGIGIASLSIQHIEAWRCA